MCERSVLHLTRCLRTLRARLQSRGAFSEVPFQAPLVAARAAHAKGSGQSKSCTPVRISSRACRLTTYRHRFLSSQQDQDCISLALRARRPHLLLEQSVKIQKIVDVRRPSRAARARASHWFTFGKHLSLCIVGS